MTGPITLEEARALLLAIKNVDTPRLNAAIDVVLASEASAVAKVEELTDLNNRARYCLGFFASVIKSGEPWTATCQAEYDNANGPFLAREKANG